MQLAMKSWLVLSLLLIGSRLAGAQPLVRHALLEEGTGGWCEWCAYGAYSIDSIQAHLGDSVVAIEWHGPGTASEPYWIPAMDSLTERVGAIAYPWLSVGRGAVDRKVALSTTYPNAWDSLVRAKARTASPVTVTIPSASYDPASKLVTVAVRATPNVSVASLPREDTSGYAIVAVVTEDSVVGYQERAAAPGFPKVSIPNFVHNNVARAVGGSVFGDSIYLGTLGGAATPAVHYSFDLGDWRAEKCRVKVILIQRSGTSSHYLDAAQTDYVTSLPPPLGAIVVTKPSAGDSVLIGQPTTVSFATSGTVSAGRSLQYSTNNGSDWRVFGNVNNALSYQWIVPNTPTNEALVRVVDDNGITGVSGVFSIVAVGTVTSVTVTGAPSVRTNTKQTIQWSTSGSVGSTLNLDISYDNKSTWFTIAQNLSATTHSYSWTTPNFAAPGAIIRAQFSSGATGYTSPFDIVTGSGVTESRIHDATAPTPNPAQSFIRLRGPDDCAGSVHMDLWDALGRLVQCSYTVEGTSLLLNIQSLPAGAYEYRFSDGGRNVWGRFEVER